MTTQAYQFIAQAPRKSWLGKQKKLTPMQARWVRAILCVWAEEYGGDGYSGGDGCGIWKFMSGWSMEETDRLLRVIEDLRKLGYKGEELLSKAKMILWPKRSIRDMIQRANDEDEADFVEKAILKAYNINNPIYVIAHKYYVGRNTVQELANYLEGNIAPWLTNKQCADRVRWCISLFDAKVYAVIQDDLKKEAEVIKSAA